MSDLPESDQISWSYAHKELRKLHPRSLAGPLLCCTSERGRVPSPKKPPDRPLAASSHPPPPPQGPSHADNCCWLDVGFVCSLHCDLLFLNLKALLVVKSQHRAAVRAPEWRKEKQSFNALCKAGPESFMNGHHRTPRASARTRAASRRKRFAVEGPALPSPQQSISAR